MQDGDYSPNIVARFWMKVQEEDRRDGCWVWTASKRDGYGQFGVRKDYIPPAHRYAYEYLVGPIPDGLALDHLCRNRACVNPKHLEPVTDRENNLRGIGFAGLNARKTHCAQGHALDGENLYVDPRGRRQCRACRRRALIEFQQRRAQGNSA